uniref:G-protein coupled receptors family 1 profile domain-containing protein n=1 Tax=Chrysemys picta bellii TaxID=8478 RepID=A0A8C3P7C0_CHRPI
VTFQRLKNWILHLISKPDRCINNLMAAFNLTPSDSSTFILMGIPGLEAAHVWISIPFSMLYIVSLLGNFTVLFVVSKEQTLHKPMFLLLCMLALTDITMSNSVMPKALCIFWFNLKGITMGGCLTQMFFLHAGSTAHSGVLVTMALDRYVAICKPLRYTTILTNARIAKLGLVGLIRAVLFILPLPLLLSRHPFCNNRIIPHTYCDHIALACADIRISSYYGQYDLFSVIGMDVFFIAVSYSLILRAIFRLPTKDARLKTFGTCISHVCAILALYIPEFFSLMYRFGHSVPLHFLILIANVFHPVPPVLHPIIYGARTKQIRGRLLQLFTHKET